MSFKTQNLEWDIPLSDIQVGENIGFTVDLAANPFYNPVLYTFNTYEDDVEDITPVTGKFLYSLNNGSTWTEYSPYGESFSQAFKLRLVVNYGEASNLFACNDSLLHQLSPYGDAIVDSLDVGFTTDNLHIDSTKDELYISGPNRTLYKFKSEGGLGIGNNSIYLRHSPLGISVDGTRQSFWSISAWDLCLSDLYGNVIYCVKLPDEIIPIDRTVSSSSSSSSSAPDDSSSSSSSSVEYSSSSSSSSVEYSSSSSSSSVEYSSSSSSSSVGYSSSSSSSSVEYSSSSSSSSLKYVCETELINSVPSMTGYNEATILPDSANADFEDGNTGFDTEGTYTATGPIGYNTYTVGSNPSDYMVDWPDMGDHTSGSGKMMLLSGDLFVSPPNTGTEFLIYEIPESLLNVGQRYTFSAWTYGLRDMTPRSSRIRLRVDWFDAQPDEELEAVVSSPDFNPTYGAWTEFSEEIEYLGEGTGTVPRVAIEVAPSIYERDNELAIDDVVLSATNVPTISSSTEYGTAPEPQTPKAWKAFNTGSYTNYGFYGSINDLGFGYISVEFLSAVIIDAYSFSNKNLATVGGTNPGPTHWKLQATNVASPDYTTDTDWVDLDERTYYHWENNSFPDYNHSFVCLYNIENSTAYIHYRIKVLATQDVSGYFYMNDIKLEEA